MSLDEERCIPCFLFQKRTRDVAVEAMGVPLVSVTDADRDQVMNDVIDAFVAARRRLGFPALPPPDVYTGLKFTDQVLYFPKTTQPVNGS